MNAFSRRACPIIKIILVLSSIFLQVSSSSSTFIQSTEAATVPDSTKNAWSLANNEEAISRVRWTQLLSDVVRFEEDENNEQLSDPAPESCTDFVKQAEDAGLAITGSSNFEIQDAEQFGHMWSNMYQCLSSDDIICGSSLDLGREHCFPEGSSRATQLQEEGKEVKEFLLLGGVDLLCFEKPRTKRNITASQWGQALGASFLNSLVAFIGIGMLVKGQIHTLTHRAFKRVVAFAVGALLGAVFIHILPEGAYLNGGFDWKYSTLFISGIFSGMVVEAFTHILKGHTDILADEDLEFGADIDGVINGNKTSSTTGADAEGDDDADVDVEGGADAEASTSENKRDKAVADETQVQGGEPAPKNSSENNSKSNNNNNSKRHKAEGHAAATAAGAAAVAVPFEVDVASRMATATNILVGDGFHNFSDGLLLGVSFSLCDPTTGWLVTSAIIVHEIPGELIDFALLVKCGLSIPKALAYNFLSQAASILGVIIALSISQVSEVAQGRMLAFGVGILTFIALTELAPMLTHGDNSVKSLTLNLFLVIAGMVVMGLTQLHHLDCADPNFGHGHAH